MPIKTNYVMKTLEAGAMNNNVAKIEKTHNKEVAEEIVMHSPFPSGESMLFQVFFLVHDQNQSVEVVETDQIDFGEIIQRLQRGESVFIKYKNPETLESSLKRKREEKKPWYFYRC
ncbi:MAG: hypothetical protein JSW14_00540 [Candidatus Bathyarchaeum sp.]|nr:MAG: hypothetical protein JSW14_00540 [Candidatus Bathyarchaeum sp.]